MNRTCKVCGRLINELHGNSEKCLKHQKKPNAKKVTVHREETVTMTYKKFKELERLAKIGKRYEGITKLIEEKRCIDCGQCNQFNGVCIYEGDE